MPRKQPSDEDDARPERVGVVLTPAALSREAAAAFCGVSVSTWDEWAKAERTPRPLEVRTKDKDGADRPFGRRLWSRIELEEWVLAGMPERHEWESMRRSQQRMDRKGA